MSIKKSILVRVRIAFLLSFLIVGGIIYRLVKIQVIEGEQWIGLGESIGLKVMEIPATRGNIYADDGSLLATSLPFYQIAFDPYISSDGLFKSKIDSLSILLANYFQDKTHQQYKAKIERSRKAGRRYLILSQKQVGYQDKKRMEHWPIFRNGRMKGGIIFEKVEERFLPFSKLGYRTIGRVNANNRGTVGLEFSFNKQLAGQNGEALFQRMSGGGWKPVFDGTEVRSVDGFDIRTTLNVDLQDIAESALYGALKQHGADYGVAVVMEVNTGEIKAISNLSRTESGNYWEKYNYAVGSQGSREPGSTFKLASMIALLEETNIKPTDSVDTGDGKMEFYDRIMRDHKKGGFGKLTVQEIFEKSSNIGIAKLVNEHFAHKPDKFIEYFEEMGLNKPLGFQMVGEGVPYIKNTSDSTWSGVTLPWMSHGYELKMTPLQTLALFNAVANDGKLIQPIIVKSVNKADRKIDTFKPRIINGRICSEQTLNRVKSMLEGVVLRGTAKNISNSKYPIAGKTGTAKKVINKKYTNKYYTSFAGYFPADNPKYSCIVVIDDPKGFQIYGSDVAAPVFKEIADRIYALEIDMHEIKDTYAAQTGVFPVIKSGNHDELKYLCNELGISNHSSGDEPWVTTQVVNQSIFWKDNEVSLQQIPDVRGMTLRDAIYVLENLGLKVSTEGRGRVAEQSQLPGRKLNKGSRITLTLS
ncbi:MAG: transpeptidase family protein [Cytophagales bacterium]|nr:transpeptidase family protein [Cytophagales bacterium]